MCFTSYSAYPGDEEAVVRCINIEPFAFIEKGSDDGIDRLYLLI